MIDLRNIDFYLKHFEDKVHQSEINICDYFNIDDLNKNIKDKLYTRNNTPREEFYLYQNIHSYYEIDNQLFLRHFNGNEDEDEDIYEDYYDYEDSENSVDDEIGEDDDDNDVVDSRFIIYTKLWF